MILFKKQMRSSRPASQNSGNEETLQGKPEQELTLVLILIFQHEKRSRCGEFVKVKLRDLWGPRSSAAVRMAVVYIPQGR